MSHCWVKGGRDCHQQFWICPNGVARWQLRVHYLEGTLLNRHLGEARIDEWFCESEVIIIWPKNNNEFNKKIFFLKCSQRRVTSKNVGKFLGVLEWNKNIRKISRQRCTRMSENKSAQVQKCQKSQPSRYENDRKSGTKRSGTADLTDLV